MREIVQYLREVAAQECQVYTQTNLINRLSNTANKLGIMQRISKPEELRPWRFELLGENPFSLSAIIAALYFAFIFFKDFFTGFKMLNAIPDNWSIFTSPLKVFCIVFILEVIIRNISDYVDHNTRCKKQYNEKLSAYNKAVQNDKKRVQRELQQKEILLRQIDQVKQEKGRTQAALNALYSLGIIHPKYRNLVAVSSFFDYFDTGRCISLTGPGGAYATYEEDLRFQRVEARLDIIISKLDEIIANQQYIGQLMQEANSTLYRIEQKNEQIAKSMNKAAENSELTAYNTRCAAQSAAIMEHISVYYALKNQ